MATTYKRKYGIDFPVEYSDTFIDMTVAKKWRLFEARGDKPDVDPGECMERAVTGLFGDRVKMSPWTRQMIHDFAREDKLAYVGCGACGKSHAMAACGLVFWLTDPFDTAVVVGSATLKDLQTRAWAPMLELFTHIKTNEEGVPIPGRILDNQYAIRNERDLSMAATVGARASIQGRALEEGRLHGLHVPWVLLIVDELALVRDIEALKDSITNIRIGTLGFKFVSAANPEPWEHPNSCFYLHDKGDKVTVDSGSWRSTAGYFVRHFDGEKSPVVLDPRLKAEYPFLMSQEDIDDALRMSNGDTSAYRYWKMIRGFPLAAGVSMPTVLGALEATRNRVTEPLEPPMSGQARVLGLCAGVDPAWSHEGDAAVYARVRVVEQDGRPILDFGGGVSRLHLSVASNDPITLQLRNGVLDRIRADSGPPISRLYVDSSGNQGLADDLDIYVGRGCGHINASEKPSDNPLRANDSRPARTRVRDRQAEAWFVLAEFCRAGQVRGLPQEAAKGLLQRRYVTRAGTTVAITPLRMESKEEYGLRYRGSPDETDACALAALAVHERLGIIPFGAVPVAVPDAILPTAYSEAQGYRPPTPIPDADYASDFSFDMGLYAPD